MSQINIGWSEVSIVPEKGRKVNVVGQFYERITDEVYDPISVTALAIECGTESVIFCSCDLVGVSNILLTAVREHLKEVRPDVPGESIVLNAIHTHTSFGYGKRSDYPEGMSGGFKGLITNLFPDIAYEDLVSYDGPDLFDGEEAFDFLVDRISKAVTEAWDRRAEGMYATGFGRAAVGLCRRVCYDDGSAKMWGDTNFANFETLEAGNDSGIELLFTYTPDKKLTGVIANVACPAQVLEHHSFMSADYWGGVKANLRAEFGEDLFVLGLCSAAGDQCPRDMIRWVNPEKPINDPNITRDVVIPRDADPSMFDPAGCKRVARRISTEILYALEDVSQYVSDTKLVHETIHLNVPLRRVTIQDRDEAMKAIVAFGESKRGQTLSFKDSAMMHIHAGTLARYELQQKMDTIENEIHVLRLGDIAFATNPYELFLDYGNKIRARSPARQTFLIQLCCGGLGYLPTEKAEKGSHYSAYVSSGVTGHEGGDLLVRTTLTKLRNMWK